MRRVGLGLVITLALPLSAAEPEVRWSGWRGNDGRGIADGAKLPVAWSAEKSAVEDHDPRSWPLLAGDLG